MAYVRMIIGEAVSCDQLGQFRSIYKQEIEPSLLKEPGCLSPGLLFEEGGRMMIVWTVWDTREHCLSYHASRSYRQFVAKTQHLLIGDFVEKLFRLE